MDSLHTTLQERVAGAIYTASGLRDEHRTNFGRIVQAAPRFVVEPRDAADVAAVIRFALERGLTVSTRGAAHSQSRLATSDGGILLCMRSMGRILAFDPEARTVDVEAGALWRDVVHHTAEHDLYPPVLTNNLGVTVAGTISTAGVGVASFRHGTQGDHVQELDVVTGNGDLVTCTPEREAELFWAVIAGLGQVGIVTRVRLALRRAKPMTRTYDLLYDDLGGFLDDLRAAMHDGRFDHLESWASPCPQGLRRTAGRAQVFARWFFPFHLTVEYEAGAPPDDAALLAGLRPYERVHTEDLPTLDFLERLEPVFELWKRAGAWEQMHPWVETVLPWKTAAAFIGRLLPDVPPPLLAAGHALVWPARNSTSRSHLFMRPEGEDLLGFGILPSVPAAQWPLVRPLLERVSEGSLLAGGKRYLSGWVEFDAARWRAHFGPRWDGFRTAKMRYDPHRILNPGFVLWDEPAPAGGPDPGPRG